MTTRHLALKYTSDAVFCPHRGCGQCAADPYSEGFVDGQIIECNGCGKAYSVKVHTVVEYETEILEDVP